MNHQLIQNSKQYLLKLLAQEAYKEGNFTLTSGEKSNYYINSKLATLHPIGCKIIGQLLCEYIPEEITAIAGVTLGGDPLVVSTNIASTYTNRVLTPLIIRKQSKGHGTNDLIEGYILPPKTKVIVLEDVVTTGMSSMKAVDILINSGYIVPKVVSIVDRLQGGQLAFKNRGIEYESIFSIEDIQTYWSELRS